jgi:hypothetical protein
MVNSMKYCEIVTLSDCIHDVMHVEALLKQFNALKKYIGNNQVNPSFVAQRKSTQVILSMTEQSIQQLQKSV